MCDEEMLISFNHIVDTVSYFSLDWVTGFVNTLRNLATVSPIPLDLRVVGLPADFPFMAEDFSEVFHWVQLSEDETSQTNIGIRVHFTFQRYSTQRPESLLVWSVRSDGA
ncbi:hypothetical protein Moror_5563 [Moniliophthora roreri MCA 2997]|uniref:Uncharacterized protein n=1 Tax=Moniliophthora roreri (strain MCA 2997) TaxID=1381753 RepID=V2Y922_MONRO|nr:hypothetical protein Moror_5563 [Moniliophthora roreri MCA 2997]